MEMQEENRVLLRIYTIIAVVVCTMAGIIATCEYSVKAKAFSLGYERGTVPGASGGVWVKADCGEDR